MQLSLCLERPGGHQPQRLRERPLRRAQDRLNEYTTVGGVAFAHDANGNLTSDRADTFTYDAENRLVARSCEGNDPLARVHEASLWKSLWTSSGQARFLVQNGCNLGPGFLAPEPAEAGPR